jgi:hypothetical protein
VCGRQTIAYLKYFEDEANRRHPDQPVVRDGRIDPIKPGTSTGPISRLVYKILRLNQACVVRRPSIQMDLEKDPSFPAELTPFLYVSF